MANKYVRKIFNMLSHTGEVYQYYTEIHFLPITMEIIQKTKNKFFQTYGEKDPS
jgi:hypothetical protein